jgi:hypothetical protein
VSDQQSFDPRTETSRSERSSAWMIILGSVLMVAGMAAHPTVRHHGIREVLEDVSAIAVRNGLVHGGLLIVMGFVLVGLIALSVRLGWSSNRVRAALVFHATGFAFMVAAATLNGFVITRIAAQNRGATDGELEALAPILSAFFHVNQVSATLGVVALSIAITAWSAALFGRGRGARAVAILGFVIAAAPLLMLVMHSHLDAHVFGAMVLAHAVWYASAAVWLLRTRVPAAHEVAAH